MNKRVFFKKIFTILLISNFVKIKKITAKEKVTKSKEEWKKILTA